MFLFKFYTDLSLLLEDFVFVEWASDCCSTQQFFMYIMVSFVLDQQATRLVGFL